MPGQPLRKLFRSPGGFAHHPDVEGPKDGEHLGLHGRLEAGSPLGRGSRHLVQTVDGSLEPQYVVAGVGVFPVLPQPLPQVYDVHESIVRTPSDMP